MSMKLQSKPGSCMGVKTKFWVVNPRGCLNGVVIRIISPLPLTLRTKIVPGAGVASSLTKNSGV
eukprot:215050-Pelagomonas_calceolata.AAC.1